MRSGRSQPRDFLRTHSWYTHTFYCNRRSPLKLCRDPVGGGQPSSRSRERTHPVALRRSHLRCNTTCVSIQRRIKRQKQRRRSRWRRRRRGVTPLPPSPSSRVRVVRFCPGFRKWSRWRIEIVFTFWFITKTHTHISCRIGHFSRGFQWTRVKNVAFLKLDFC